MSRLTVSAAGLPLWLLAPANAATLFIVIPGNRRFSRPLAELRRSELQDRGMTNGSEAQTATAASFQLRSLAAAGLELEVIVRAWYHHRLRKCQPANPLATPYFMRRPSSHWLGPLTALINGPGQPTMPVDFTSWIHGKPRLH